MRVLATSGTRWISSSWDTMRIGRNADVQVTRRSGRWVASSVRPWNDADWRDDWSAGTTGSSNRSAGSGSQPTPPSSRYRYRYGCYDEDCYGYRNGATTPRRGYWDDDGYWDGG